MAGSSLLLAAVGDIAWVIIALASFAVWVFNQIKKANEDAARKAQPTAPKPDSEQPPPRASQSGSPSRRQQPPVRGQQQPRQRTPARPALSSTQGAEGEPWAKPEAVASHVHRHLDTQEFEQRSGSLGQLEHLDSGVDEHVHEAFDHEVSTITDQGAVTEGEQAGGAQPILAGAAAAGIAELLSDPDSLRNAIILQEVLRPPKWD
jgi:hypothetical protein